MNCIMNNIDQLPFGFSLPILSDDVAVEIHNFLQIVIQIFEARYGEEIDRHHERPVSYTHLTLPTIYSV